MASEQEGAPPQGERQYAPSWTIYKPRKDGGGCASSWELDLKKGCVWMAMAPQIGKMEGDDNAKFDWKNKRQIKLGLADIGELVSVLQRRQDGAGPPSNREGSSKHRGLYHKNASGSTTLAFDKANQGTGWYLKMGVQKAGEKEVQSLSHAVTLGEGCVLLTLLLRAIELIVRWAA